MSEEDDKRLAEIKARIPLTWEASNDDCYATWTDLRWLIAKVESERGDVEMLEAEVRKLKTDNAVTVLEIDEGGTVADVSPHPLDATLDDVGTSGPR